MLDVPPDVTKTPYITQGQAESQTCVRLSCVVCLVSYQDDGRYKMCLQFMTMKLGTSLTCVELPGASSGEGRGTKPDDVGLVNLDVLSLFPEVLP